MEPVKLSFNNTCTKPIEGKWREFSAGREYLVISLKLFNAANCSYLLSEQRLKKSPA
jgi:hypothetical protein